MWLLADTHTKSVMGKGDQIFGPDFLESPVRSNTKEESLEVLSSLKFLRTLLTFPSHTLILINM